MKKKKKYSIGNFGDVAAYSGYSEFYKALHNFKISNDQSQFDVTYSPPPPPSPQHHHTEWAKASPVREYMQAHQIDRVQNTIMWRKFLTSQFLFTYIFNTSSHGRRQNRLNMV